MKTVYIVWAIVPFALLSIAMRGFYKYRIKKGLRDDYRFTFLQGIYSAVFLGAAILCDLYIFDPIMEINDVQDKIVDITRFLVYPVVLLVASMIQGRFTKRAEKKLVKRRYY